MSAGPLLLVESQNHVVQDGFAVQELTGTLEVTSMIVMISPGFAEVGAERMLGKRSAAQAPGPD